VPIRTEMNDLRASVSARPVRRGVLVVLLALLVPPGTLLLLRAVPALDLVLRSAVGHLVVVSAISACALAVAAAAAAGHSRDGSLVLLALGCLGVGFLMLTHGLVTPGIGGRPVNLWVGRLPVLAIATFAVCLTAAAWPGRPPPTAPTASSRPRTPATSSPIPPRPARGRWCGRSCPGRPLNRRRAGPKGRRPDRGGGACPG
jgi:hypothetical protein